MRNMHRSDAPSVVAVNISGTEFQVARQVLLRHPDTFLHGLIYRRPDVEYIFIDGDAEIFSYILQFLRHGSVFADVRLHQRILQQADCFGLRPMLEKVLYPDIPGKDTTVHAKADCAVYVTRDDQGQVCYVSVAGDDRDLDTEKWVTELGGQVASGEYSYYTFYDRVCANLTIIQICAVLHAKGYTKQESLANVIKCTRP